MVRSVNLDIRLEVLILHQELTSPRMRAEARPTLVLLHGRRTRDLLERHGVDLTYREYSMAHQVSAEEMVEARAWLDGVLDQAGPTATR